MDWNALVNSAVTGLFAGAGGTIGTYLITKHFIQNLERVEAKIREKAKNGEVEHTPQGKT